MSILSQMNASLCLLILLAHNNLLIILTSISEMIFQKDKRNDLQAKLKTNKNIKPYSILSLGFMKPLDRNNENRSRQIPDIRLKDKISSKTFKNQNCMNQNINYMNSSDSTTISSIFNDKNSQSIREDYYASICSIDSIDLPILNEEISKKPETLKLSNITNQILQDPFRKRKDSIFASNPEFQQLEQPSIDQKQERIYVDMKKKIKKLSNGKKKMFLSDKLKIKSDQNLANLPNTLPMERNHQFPLTSRIYSDSDVIIDGSIFRNKLISQRIDNDVETDDEQIASGIRRLHKSLSQATQAAQQQRKWEIQRQRMFEMQFM